MNKVRNPENINPPTTAIPSDTLLNAHIKLLSRISRLMNKDDFRERLEEAKSPAEVLKLFKEEEQTCFDA